MAQRTSSRARPDYLILLPTSIHVKFPFNTPACVKHVDEQMCCLLLEYVTYKYILNY